MRPSRPKEERAQDQIERGMAAARLIEDAVVISFFESEHRRIVEEMITAPISDDESRRSAALKLQALRDLRSHLETTAAFGRNQQEKAKANG